MSPRRARVKSAAERLNELPTEAIECRRLRHAWPRRSNPRHAHLIRFEVTEREPRTKRVIAGVRYLTCLGNCGTERMEKMRRNRDGLMVREGRLGYQRHKPYLLPKPDPDTPAEPISSEVLEDAMMRRMFPELKW